MIRTLLRKLMPPHNDNGRVGKAPCTKMPLIWPKHSTNVESTCSAYGDPLGSAFLRVRRAQRGSGLIREFLMSGFCPKPETFAKLEIDEQRENGRYLYTFRGTPQM